MKNNYSKRLIDVIEYSREEARQASEQLYRAGTLNAWYHPRR